MKKMLSLVGAVALSSTAVLGTSNLITITQTLPNNGNAIFNSALSSENPLKDGYEALSLEEQILVSNEMKNVAELELSQIAVYLENSNSSFLREHQLEIIQMAELYNSFKELQNSPALHSFADLNIAWSQINDLIDLDFTDSNDYNPWVDVYGPSSWWNFWEWGWQINFPEGDINIMKLVNLGFTYFDGISFEKLEGLINSVKPFFDYVRNIEDHKDDTVQVLYDLILETQAGLRESGLPFTEQFYAIFDQFTNLMFPIVRRLPLSSIIGIVDNALKGQLGMSLEELGTTYLDKFNMFAEILPKVNEVLKIFKDTLPAIFITLFLDSIKSISLEMVAADHNRRGVSLKFQQFFIPMGFYAL